MSIMEYFRKKARRGSPSGSSSADDSTRESRKDSKKDKGGKSSKKDKKAAKKKEGKSSLKDKLKSSFESSDPGSPPPFRHAASATGSLCSGPGSTSPVLPRVASGPGSLAVPTGGARIRSSSFDTSTLRHGESDNTLKVPTHSRRSASFDAAYNSGGSTSEDCTSDREAPPSSTFLGLPKYYRRRPLEIPRLCIHCLHLEAMSSAEGSPASEASDTFRYDHQVSFVAGSQSSGSEWEGDSGDDDEDRNTPRDILLSRTKGITLCVTPSDSDDALVPIDPSLIEQANLDEGVITLQVPILKPRSSSLDAGYLQPGSEDRRASLDFLQIPKQPRSTSVDVNLPTEESGHYQAYTSQSKRWVTITIQNCASNILC